MLALARVGIEGVATSYGYGRLQYGPQLSSVTDAPSQWIGYKFDAWGRGTMEFFTARVPLRGVR